MQILPVDKYCVSIILSYLCHVTAHNTSVDKTALVLAYIEDCKARAIQHAQIHLTMNHSERFFSRTLHVTYPVFLGALEAVDACTVM